MSLVRWLIVIFFLAVVPVAAALDAVAPQYLDSALGRKPRGAAQPAAQWENGQPLVLRTAAPEPVLRSAEPNTPAAAPNLSVTPTGALAETAPREGLSADMIPASNAAPFSEPPSASRAHEPVYRGEMASGAPASPPPLTGNTAAIANTPAASATDSQLLAMQNHLSELGATYMRLESTGANARTYRFLCQMQLRPGKTEVVPFEATAADPLEAMHRVVSDVEAWQAMEITRLRR